MMMIRVRKWKPVAAWLWKSPLETASSSRECGICQHALEAACSDCTVPGNGCPVVLGQCSHLFHSHCIVKWTSAQLDAAAANEFLAVGETPAEPCCPMCRQKWQLSEEYKQ